MTLKWVGLGEAPENFYWLPYFTEQRVTIYYNTEIAQMYAIASHNAGRTDDEWTVLPRNWLIL